MSSIIIATWQDIARVLATKRVYDGLTQTQMAALLHVSPSLVASYETGRRTPPADALIQWANTGGYDLALFRRSQSQP